jgi:hypothetical protein
MAECGSAVHLAQIRKQAFRGFQIGGVEALGELCEYRLEKLPRAFSP